MLISSEAGQFKFWPASSRYRGYLNRCADCFWSESLNAGARISMRCHVLIIFGALFQLLEGMHLTFGSDKRS